MTTSTAPNMRNFGQRDWLYHCRQFNITPSAFQGAPDYSEISTDFDPNAPCKTFPDRLAADTHFLFLGMSGFAAKELSIMRWHELLGKNPSHPRLNASQHRWYENEPFATNETCGPRWYAPLTSPVPDTERVSDVEFEANYLKTNEHDSEALTPIEIVTMEILHYWKYREYTDTGNGMRASGRTLGGKCINIKCTLDLGIYIFAEEIPKPVASKTKSMAKAVRVPITES